MDKIKNDIPRIPRAFFKWYCKGEKYEELHGDLEEFFHDRVEEIGVKKARLLYLWDVIRCFQPYAWKKASSPSNPTIMLFKNYYKTSFRNLTKNPLTSFINVFGLAVAIGVCMLCYSFTQWVFKIDQFHENKEEVYLTTFYADRDGTLQQNGLAPLPLGQMLEDDFPQIERVCRIEDRNVVAKYEDKVFHERIRLVDEAFLDMFTFPLKWGVSSSLADLNSVILSEETAIKYFGSNNPIGESILLKFDEERGKTFTVSGVAKAFPEAASIAFDFLINFENYQYVNPEQEMGDWSSFIGATLIQVKNPQDVSTIHHSMDKYIILQNASQNEWAIESFAFEQLSSLYENSGNIRNSISGTGYDDNFKAIQFLSGVSILMLLLACFNYINIAIVSAAKRLKEIGVRKVIGANRRMVITQFLAENVFVTFFALMVGVIIGITLFIPWFERLNNFEMDFILDDKYVWIVLPIILFVTGIASGIYPAFYIARFQVVGILKGRVKFGRKNPVTKVFLVFQMIIACLLITTAVMFTQNADYVMERDWGYDARHALYAEVSDYSSFVKLKDILEQNSNVVSVSGSAHHLGRNNNTVNVEQPERDYEVNEMAVAPSYFETLGLNIQEGQFFKKQKENDQSILVNEMLVKSLGLEQPIGEVLKMDSIRYTIIGVVEDFHSYNFFYTMRPTLFTIAQEKDYQFLSLKVEDGKEQETYEALQTAWITLFPETPFQGGHQEDIWGTYFEEMGVHGRFWRAVAFIAVLLSSLGLYGLVTLNVIGRVREFSIRKVMGADVGNIAKTILRQYVFLFGVALLVGAPISYVLLEIVLDSVYDYHVPMNTTGVIIAVISLIMVLLAVVSSQIRKVANSNPVAGLKVE